jgi:type VI secretion system protein ImpJ
MPSASPSHAGDTRFSAEERMVTDVNTGVEKKPVQVARKNFRILFGSESRDGLTSMRIAQVVRNAAGTCILKPTHIAPCLDIGHNQYLMGLLQRLVEILATKSASLSATRRERGRGLADFTASETANFWLLHTANSFLPELRHIRKVRHSHPEMAYLAMMRLAGALSTFSLNSGPDDLPDYDHNDLGRCFTALDEQIRLLVDTIIREPYLVIPLTPKDRGVWTGTVPDDHFFRDSQFYLAVSAAMDTGELIQKVPTRVKAASPDEIDPLINRALTGITLTHVLAPPAVRMKLGSQYFELSQNGDLWQRVQLSRGIAIFAPADIKDPKMELIIVKNKPD